MLGDRCILRTGNTQASDKSTKSYDLWYEMVPETAEKSDHWYEIVPESDAIARNGTRISQQQRPLVRNITGTTQNSDLAANSYKKQSKPTA